ncbi:MAG: type II toxin-antitoxin system Phd/YefM family antitoxin [Clostridiales bacterium]|nr:type II toxin-antitoxin system Phd/YefM family antitoxin [Clostridiales bacterium]
MIQIRPVSDLRNKFTDIEKCVQNGDPVYLTKNGYGTMVVLSIETYSRLVESEDYIMDYADAAAESTDKRLSHEQVFDEVRKKTKRNNRK